MQPVRLDDTVRRGHVDLALPDARRLRVEVRRRHPAGRGGRLHPPRRRRPDRGGGGRLERSVGGGGPQGSKR